MPFKFDGDNIVVQDGLPVFIHENGQESPLNADEMIANLNTVTRESVARKNKIRDLESSYEPFNGIENPSEWMTNAKKALDTVANLSDKEILDAGEVEAIKKNTASSYQTKISEMEKGFETKMSEKDSLIQKHENAVRGLLIKGSFEASKFVKDQTLLTPGIAYSEFGKYFDIEEDEAGNPVAYARRGKEKIFSQKNPGSIATPEEAIEILVNEHPDKDSILRGNPSGSGSRQNSTLTGQKTISRAQFDNLDPASKQKVIQDGVVPVD